RPISRGPTTGAELDAVLQLVLKLLQGVVARRRRDLDGPDPGAIMPGQPAAVGQAPHRTSESHGQPPVQGQRRPQRETQTGSPAVGRLPSATDGTTSKPWLELPGVKTQPIALGLTVVNLFLPTFKLFRANPAPISGVAPVLRGCALEIV